MPIFSRREAGFIVFEDGGTDGSGLSLIHI